jgi:predicted membrane protein
MQKTNIKDDKKIWLGLILIFIGILFLLNSFDFFNFSISRIIFSWPFFFLIIGVFIVVKTNRKLFGGILSGIGVIFLVPKIFPNIDYNSTIILAIILISLGLYIVFKGKDKERIEIELQKDYIDDVAIFGGCEKVISSDNFRGGSITAVFGGSEINLGNCSLAEGTNVIDVLCIFGGTTIVVPRDWNVIINVTPIFGCFSNKMYKSPDISINPNKSLIITGLVIFGGGEIKRLKYDS